MFSPVEAFLMLSGMVYTGMVYVLSCRGFLVVIVHRDGVSCRGFLDVSYTWCMFSLDGVCSLL